MNKSSAFHFQQFSVEQYQCAMKVGIDGVLLGAWAPTHQPKHILDIGAGTGVLSLMMAQRTSAIIDAVEIEEKAFRQAKRNILKSIFKGRINCFHTAIQNFQTQDKYDLIISNPPYFDSALKSANEARNMARHNDILPLETLFINAQRLLAPQGQLAIILPYSAKSKVKEISLKQDLFCSRMTKVIGREHKPPKRMLFVFQKTDCNTEMNQITIYSTEGKYTTAFQNLTQNFYLPSTFR